jgi:hypothetical protein
MSKYVPRPHRLVTSVLACAPCTDHDAQATWSRKQLLRMDAEFREAVEHAIERGLERRPDGEAPERAA